MPYQTDFCILGAGLAGLSLADALQEHDCALHCIKIVETENNFVEFYG